MARRILCVLVLALGLAAGVAYADPDPDLEAELAAVLDLMDAGVSDAVIIKHIQARGFVFDLTADDILDLRRYGVSDTVIEAMLDTAIGDSDRRSRRSRYRDSDDDRDDWSLTIAGGYFSPWYQYPYAWGFYYDPFPACYSFYYYPFRYAYSWGYYGHCNNYYYRRWCAPYRWWDDPRWYSYTESRASCRVRVPRETAIAWHAGRGLHADRPAARVREGSTSRSAPRRDATLGDRLGRDRVHVRTPRTPSNEGSRSGSSADAPRRRSGVAAPRDRDRVQAPRSGRSGEAAPAPRSGRSGEAAPAPRGNREAAPAPAPRGGREAAPAPAPRGGHEAAPAPTPRHNASAPAPRSAPRTAPRSGVGARERLGS
jgi:hypothetical protein